MNKRKEYEMKSHDVCGKIEELKANKEIDNIETEVDQLRDEIDSMINLFERIIEEKIYNREIKEDEVNVPKVPEPTNKIDRIIEKLKQIIEVVRIFKKVSLQDKLESELKKL